MTVKNIGSATIFCDINGKEVIIPVGEKKQVEETEYVTDCIAQGILSEVPALASAVPGKKN